MTSVQGKEVQPVVHKIYKEGFCMAEMNNLNMENIIKVMISLLEEQEGVEIDYTLQLKEETA